ncbi:MAG: YlxR family protein [Propionicimonas sp.]
MEPERTCVACRSRAPQSELLRFVAQAGALTADPSRRLPGRGCYVHRSCLAATPARALSRSLRTRLDPDQVAEVLTGAGAD